MYILKPDKKTNIDNIAHVLSVVKSWHENAPASGAPASAACGSDLGISAQLQLPPKTANSVQANVGCIFTFPSELALVNFWLYTPSFKPYTDMIHENVQKEERIQTLAPTYDFTPRQASDVRHQFMFQTINNTAPFPIILKTIQRLNLWCTTAPKAARPLDCNFGIDLALHDKLYPSSPSPNQVVTGTLDFESKGHLVQWQRFLFNRTDFAQSILPSLATLVEAQYEPISTVITPPI